ncbi:MAG: hypothetical protein KJO07_13385 [Deltaproteobacteria bacterium]|nr:hypothetical protein [Deltaproteobacteria bacterium]
MKIWMLAFALVAAAVPASAQVTVNIEPGAGAELAAALGIEISELETQLQTEIEDAFQAVRPNAYLKAFSNAQAFSNRGLGVDYASNPTVLSCGGAGNFSAGVDEELDDDAAVSPGLNLSLMCGFNLGIINPDLRNFTVYGNFFRFKSGSFVDSLDGTLTSVGGHLQVKVFRPKNKKKELVLQWGGIDLTGGIEYSRLTTKLGSDTLFRELPVIGDELSASLEQTSVGLDSVGVFSLTTNNVIVPLEASTNLRIAYFVTVFGGIGFDFQVGQTDMDIDLTSDMTAPDPLNPGQELDLGTAEIQVEGESSPSPGRVRAFGGLQLNLWRFKIFGQVNARPEPAAVGLTLGARFAW